MKAHTAATSATAHAMIWIRNALRRLDPSLSSSRPAAHPRLSCCLTYFPTSSLAGHSRLPAVHLVSHSGTPRGSTGDCGPAQLNAAVQGRAAARHTSAQRADDGGTHSHAAHHHVHRVPRLPQDGQSGLRPAMSSCFSRRQRRPAHSMQHHSASARADWGPNLTCSKVQEQGHDPCRWKAGATQQQGAGAPWGPRR